MADEAEKQERQRIRASLPISVREMLDGASEQFKALYAEIDAFFNRQPYTVATDHHDNFTKHTQRLVWTEEYPGPRWGRLFYLGVQQLRSSLDHMVYAIAVKESGSDPPPDAEILAFPVMTNPPNVPMWKVANLSDPIRTAIDSAQPDPSNLEGSTIWQLEKFNATDKHRILRLTIARSPFVTNAITGHGGGTVNITWHPFGLEKGTPFVTVATERPAPHVNVQSRLVFDVLVERVGGHGQAEDFLPLKTVVNLLQRRTVEIVVGLAGVAGMLD